MDHLLTLALNLELPALKQRSVLISTLEDYVLKDVSGGQGRGPHTCRRKGVLPASMCKPRQVALPFGTEQRPEGAPPCARTPTPKPTPTRSGRGCAPRWAR